MAVVTTVPLSVGIGRGLFLTTRQAARIIIGSSILNCRSRWRSKAGFPPLSLPSEAIKSSSGNVHLYYEVLGNKSKWVTVVLRDLEVPL